MYIELMIIKATSRTLRTDNSGRSH